MNMAVAAGAVGALRYELRVPQLAENMLLLAWLCSLSARVSSLCPLPLVRVNFLCPLLPGRNSPSPFLRDHSFPFPLDREQSTDHLDLVLSAQRWTWHLAVADPVSRPCTLRSATPVPGCPALEHLQENLELWQLDEDFRGSHNNQV